MLTELRVGWDPASLHGKPWLVAGGDGRARPAVLRRAG